MMNKIIVAEDEYWVRKGIISKLDCDKYGLLLTGEASNGEEALDLIVSQQPDIAFIDIHMPLMDGLSVIKEAIKNGALTKFIIISGYNDFEYAQEAIKLAVFDYILKPVDDNALGEVITKIKKQLMKEKQKNEQIKKLETKISENGIVIRDNMLNDLIFNEKNYIPETGQISEKEILFEKGKYTIAIVWLISDKNSLEGNELSTRKIRDIITKISEKYNGMICFKNNRKNKELIIIFNIDKLSEEKVKFILNKILNEVQKQWEIQINIGHGPVVDGMGRLHLSYKLAYNALRNMIVEDSINRVYYYRDKSENSLLSKYISSDLKTVLEKFSKDSSAKPIIDIINNIFDKMQEDVQYLNYVTFEDICFGLFSVICKNSEVSDDNQKLELQKKLNFYEVLEGFNNIEDAHQWFIKYINESIVISSLKTSHIGEYTIFEIRDYIERYYFQKISLKDISKKFFIHPNYLSRIFKEKTGIGFNEYITSVRMQKAVELMGIGIIKIEDIANSVGYENQRYFASSFKRHYGITPTEYIKLNFGE